MGEKEFCCHWTWSLWWKYLPRISSIRMEVMAIDSDEDKINEFANIASHAVIADSTDEMVLKALVFEILIT